MSAATAWLIYGETDANSGDCGNICDGNPHCAFGVKNGVKFYCDLDEGAGAADDMVEAWLIGTPGDDWLSFWYEEGSVKCTLQNAGLGVTKIKGKILGGSGDDDIFGSPESDDTSYQDDLFGDSGEDTIMSFGGADIIHGGSKNDDIHSGSGDDVVFGEDDDDNITTGDGDDVAYGGDGVDQICTDGGDYDEMHGGNDADQLWDDDGTSDWAHGDGNSFDQCYAANMHSSCEFDEILGGRPASCPAEVEPY